MVTIVFLTPLDEIKINSSDEPGAAKIIAYTNWGILRGLESFSQIITTETDFNDNSIVSCHIYLYFWVKLDYLVNILSIDIISTYHNNILTV